jgi:hypothetical protein
MRNNKENGLITILDPGADRPLVEEKTVQCMHCGRHFTMRRGSGKVRGFCMKCNGFFCGPQCEPCVPMEQQLENMEAGRAVDHRPIQVPSGALMQAAPGSPLTRLARPPCRWP